MNEHDRMLILDVHQTKNKGKKQCASWLSKICSKKHMIKVNLSYKNPGLPTLYSWDGFKMLDLPSEVGSAATCRPHGIWHPWGMLRNDPVETGLWPSESPGCRSPLPSKLAPEKGRKDWMYRTSYNQGGSWLKFENEEKVYDYDKFCVSIFLSSYISISLSFHLSIYLTIGLSVSLSMHLTSHQYPSIYPSIYLSIYQSICLSIYPSIYPSI